MNVSKNKASGFSLIELVMVISLVGITAFYLGEGGLYTDQQRFEATRLRMQALRTAILGDEATAQAGHRMNFGYVGDWGSLPTSLVNLNSAQTPAWAFNSVNGIGAGWRGNYIGDASFGGLAVTQDAWKRNYTYLSTGATPSITSLGGDGAVGGTLFDTDLVTKLPPTVWQSTVKGNVSDGTTKVSGAIVKLVYPVAGALTTVFTTAGASGDFSFSSIPFGVRALAETSPKALGPKQIIVDSALTIVPDDVLNSVYAQRAVTYVAASRVNGGPGGTSNAYIAMNSTYPTAMQVKSVDVTWAATASSLVRIIVNGTTFTSTTPYATSPATKTITVSQIIQPNSALNNLELDFSASTVAITPTNITLLGGTITVVFHWTTGGTDTLAF